MYTSSVVYVRKYLPKRANLGNAQYSSVVPTEGSIAAPYTTGYDMIIGERVGKEFVFVAQEDGVVKKVGRNLSVEYTSGKKDGFKLGIIHGESSGNSIAHKHITDLAKGSTFKKGDVLAWNSGFFEKHFYNTNNVVLKGGALSFVALVEGNDTLEDGCAISEDLAEKMTTTVTKKKTIIVNFDQEIELVKDIGSDVSYEDVICRISNYIPGIEETESTLSALEKYSGSNPSAGSSGTITGMELIYMGDKQDMAPKLKELADRFDSLVAADKRELGGRRPSSCATSEPVFMGGERVTQDTLAITFYIDKRSPMGIGDKKIFANQLKSIVGRKMTGINETESGIPLGAKFGLKSVFARIVGSGFISGGYNRVIHWGSHEFVRLARGG